MSELLGADDVRYVAALARLELTEQETELFAEQLSSVLGHIESLRRLDTDGVPPTSHPLELRNVLRSDDVTDCLRREEALAAAPAVEDGRFKVPRILGEAP